MRFFHQRVIFAFEDNSSLNLNNRKKEAAIKEVIKTLKVDLGKINDKSQAIIKVREDKS
jgi:hypothetical protein